MSSRGLLNKNPGNIRLSKTVWIGEVRPGRDKSFCEFETMAYGYRALLKLLQNYKIRYNCDTIHKMISRWAPPNENNTESYIGNVSRKVGLSADAVVDVTNKDVMLKIAAAISESENGVKAVMSDIETGWSLL